VQYNPCGTYWDRSRLVEAAGAAGRSTHEGAVLVEHTPTGDKVFDRRPDSEDIETL